MDTLFLEIIVIIFLLSIIQSIIGVGILIVGTPVLLAYNFNFFVALQILLPCSIIVNLYQLLNTTKKKISPFFKKIFLFYCLPFVPIGLILIYFLKEQINFKILIGFLILMIMILKNIYKIKKISEIKKKYILIFIGLFHGLTNLGGTLLSLFLSTINKNNVKIKMEIDYGYLFLASTQYLFLILFLNGKFEIKNIILIIASIISCLIGNKVNPYIIKKKFLFFLNIIIILSASIAIVSNFK
jgi:uncharacterized membrane protein YfcA